MGQSAKGRATSRPIAGWLVSVLFLVAVAAWGYVTVRETVSPGLEMGDVAPALDGTGLDGEAVSLAALRGTPVMIRFSSRTCSFCYDDFGVLEQLQQRYQGQLHVIAVEVGAPEAMVRSAVRGRNRSYPVLVDPEGRIAERYQVPSIPALYFIDGEGLLVSRVAGEVADVDVAAHVARAQQGVGSSTQAVEARVRAIAQEVRCQECRGLSAWESHAPSAWEMKQEIWARVEAGETREAILADLVNRYGVWILMRPPARGGFLWAYLVPVMFVGVAGLLLQRLLRTRIDDGTAGPHPTSPPALDPEAEARVRERLQDYL